MIVLTFLALVASSLSNAPHAAAIMATFDNEEQQKHRSRHLFWDVFSNERCSLEQLELARIEMQVNKVDPCYVMVQSWDPDSVLVVQTITAYEIGQVELDLPESLVKYTAAYSGNTILPCQHFDGCSRTNGSPTLEYEYDCSNVYCGPNAKRTCNGDYSTVACIVEMRPPPTTPRRSLRF